LSLKSLLSVGIDVGTTSMHLSINRLLLSNISRLGEPERIVVSGFEKIYESPIRLTPLTPDAAIDADAILAFIKEQYEQAGLQFDDIASGAVIVTGETAKIRNAEVMVERVSSLSGQFVVASAGPNFESFLAGKGSGAAAYSRESGKVVCNVDVGGGTTNIAVFERGELKSSSAVSLGGRLVSLDHDLKILKLTESARSCFAQLNISTESGDTLSFADATALADYAAGKIIESITEPGWTDSSLITQPLSIDASIDEYWFSGGVAELMTDLTKIHSDTEYGDLGVFLARSLLSRVQSRALQMTIPHDAIRATVIGAAVHTLQLSGSTVWVPDGLLPLSGVPVIVPQVDRVQTVARHRQAHLSQSYSTGEVPSATSCPSAEAALDMRSPSEVAPSIPRCPDAASYLEAVAHCLEVQEIEWKSTVVALTLPHIGRADYRTIKQWANLVLAAVDHFGARQPCVLLVPHDVGVALGQCVRAARPGTCVMSLDCVNVTGAGHYIDIGAAVAGAGVPVVVKSLVFPHLPVTRMGQDPPS
jgi:ethanolamine utilization protein EutA